MVSEQSRVQVKDDFTVADLGGETVALDLNTGSYYGLNEVGTHVLDLIKQPTTVQHILDELERQYEVDPHQLKSDVLHFLQQMEDQQLLRVVERDVQ